MRIYSMDKQEYCHSVLFLSIPFLLTGYRCLCFLVEEHDSLGSIGLEEGTKLVHLVTVDYKVLHSCLLQLEVDRHQGEHIAVPLVQFRALCLTVFLHAKLRWEKEGRREQLDAMWCKVCTCHVRSSINLLGNWHKRYGSVFSTPTKAKYSHRK